VRPDAAEEPIPDPIDDAIDHAMASIEQQTEMLRELDRDACLASLAEMVQLAFLVILPGVELEWGRHLQAVCDHVQWQLEDRWATIQDRSRTRKLKVQNLVVNLPPRSLKTIILTIATVWAWLRWPSLKIMYLSANPRVASTSARMARDLMRHHWFRTTFATRWSTEYIDRKENRITEDKWEAANPVDDKLWELRTDQDALSDLGNTKGGVRISRGLSSTITGEGCDWLCIDDPHDMRDSIAKVDKAVEDYDSSVHNRLNNPLTGIRTLIMQRGRPNDLAAKLIRDRAPGLLHLRLPTEYEAPDGKVECECSTCTGVNAFGWQD